MTPQLPQSVAGHLQDHCSLSELWLHLEALYQLREDLFHLLRGAPAASRRLGRQHALSDLLKPPMLVAHALPDIVLGRLHPLA